MLIAVVGGKLQGVEVVYLAQKAGWQTLVIDKDPGAPAIGLCDRFLEFEFSPENPIPPFCPEIDFILPAVEDIDVLTAVKFWAKTNKIPLALDLDAYLISNSKLKSQELFKRINLRFPAPWPECGFPVVIKPDQASGSQGVKIILDSSKFSTRFPDFEESDDTVVQEYLDGPSYSIEIIGKPGNYHALQVTDLGMDEIYDCKKVTAPTLLPDYQTDRFIKMARSIADEISLTGIMDVEVILNKNELVLLEIDARFPSQTPLTVFWSTRINMVEMLADLFLSVPCGRSIDKFAPAYERSTLVEHVKISGCEIQFSGEHIMSREGHLSLRPGFFGADEAITSFSQGKSEWVATMIFTGDCQTKIDEKRRNCYDQILEHMKNNL